MMTIYFHFVLEIKLKIRLIILNGSFFLSASSHSFMPKNVFFDQGTVSEQSVFFSYLLCDSEITLTSVYSFHGSGTPSQKNT